MKIHTKKTYLKILKLLPKKLTKQSICSKMKIHTKKNELCTILVVQKIFIYIEYMKFNMQFKFN